MFERRIERLEKQNRQLKFLATAAFCMALVPFALGAGNGIQDDVRSRAFTLVDEKGKIRSRWSVTPDDSAELVLAGSGNNKLKADGSFVPDPDLSWISIAADLKSARMSAVWDDSRTSMAAGAHTGMIFIDEDGEEKWSAN